MREWTREERYRVLQNQNEIADLHKRIQNSAYRQTYHVQPVTGLSCDPNGFVRHEGRWHLFYQWCPWGAVHGLKYWYHVTSEDLICWKNEGIGLKPDSVFDNRGVYSGSAVSEDGVLYLFYTGNHRDDDWTRIPYTCAATLDKDQKPVKPEQPLFGPDAGHTEHQRDPKVFYEPERKTYYIFLGAQSRDLKGCILVYESEQLLKGWHFAGELKIPGYESFGGMWECPCMGRIGGKDVLTFCPQYTKLPGRGENTSHNICLIGRMDYDTLTFLPESDYMFLDHGFDFYAAQMAANTKDPDKAILSAWMGLPDNHYPTEEEDWEGSLIIPRELTIRNGRLCQNPISGIEKLRRHRPALQRTLPKACELEVQVLDDQDFDLSLFTDRDGRGGMKLHYDAARCICTVDRSGLKRRFNEKAGEVLEMPLNTPLRNLRIFIDRSSAEIFANQGEAVFTSHVYPTEAEHHYTTTQNLSMRLWELQAGVRDDFVI